MYLRRQHLSPSPSSQRPTQPSGHGWIHISSILGSNRDPKSSGSKGKSRGPPSCAAPAGKTKKKQDSRYPMHEAIHLCQGLFSENWGRYLAIETTRTRKGTGLLVRKWLSAPNHTEITPASTLEVVPSFPKTNPGRGVKTCRSKGQNDQNENKKVTGIMNPYTSLVSVDLPRSSLTKTDK